MSKRASIPLLALLASCAACVRAIDLQLPDPGDAKSFLLAVVSGERVLLEAYDLGTPLATQITALDGSEVAVFHYRQTRAELMLDHHPAATSTTPITRPIPRWQTAQHFFARGGDHPLWDPIRDLSPQLAAARLRGFDPGECATRIGCWRSCETHCAGDCEDDLCANEGDCPRQCLEPTPLIAPAEPAPPARVELVCPDSWTVLAPSSADPAVDIDLCEPPDPALRSPCPEGQHRFGLEEDCFTVGTACPTNGAWGSLPAGRPIAYVRAGASPGGDGSAIAPYATIAAAAQSASTVVAIAAGDYFEELELLDNVSVIGACASDTRIHSVSGGAVVSVAAPGAELRNVTLIGGSAAVAVGAGGSLRVAEVIIEDAAVGLRADNGGRLRVERSIVRDVTSHGVLAAGVGAVAHLERVILERGAGYASYAHAQGKLVLDRVTVRDAPAIDSAHAMVVSTATASVIDSHFDRPMLYGVFADVRSSLDVDGLRIDGVRPPLAGDGGFGISIFHSRLSARGLAIIGTSFAGIWALGSDVELDGARIADVRGPRIAREVGYGIAMSSSTSTLTNVIVERTSGRGFDFTGGTALLRDVVYLGERIADDLERRMIALEGIYAVLSQVAIERLLIVRARGRSLVAHGSGTTLSLLDGTIRDPVLTSSAGIHAAGMTAEGDARLEAARVLIERPRTYGLTVVVNARVEINDLRIANVGRMLTTGGTALTFAAAGKGDLERVVIDTAETEGIGVSDPGSSLTVRDLFVQATRKHGVRVQNGAALVLERGHILEAAVAGIEVASGEQAPTPTVAFLTDVQIEGVESDDETEGACVHVASYGVLDPIPPTAMIRRFAFRRCEAIGLEVDPSVGIDVADGQIADTPAGITLRDTTAPVAPVTDRVQFINVQKAIVLGE